MTTIRFLVLLIIAFLVGFFLFYKKISLFPDTSKPVPFKLKKIKIEDLPGWNLINKIPTVQSFKKSCNGIMKKNGTEKMHVNGVYGHYEQWQQVCQAFKKLTNPNNHSFSRFVKKYFHAYQLISSSEKASAFFTGYYEPELQGSYKKDKRYNYPLYETPKNLIVSEDLGVFKKELKGIRIKGLIEKNVFKPFYNRKQIDTLKINSNHFKPIVWVESDIDAFFLHIQGSGLVRLPNGNLIRVGYAEQNGHPYIPIGRLLIEKGIGTPKTMGMDLIKSWLQSNPEKGKKLMHENPSYIFFRKLKSEGPIGTMGVPLTPEASLAIDKTYHALGVPMWVSAEHPLKTGKKIHRFVIAQDTGGAIKGPLRGDLFWGPGKKAARYAGEMKSSGDLYVLIPKTVKLNSEYLETSFNE
jgi:membrane-bound lytic murein transglycosylase A